MNEIKLNNERKDIFKKHFLTPIENLIKLGKIGNPEENSLSDKYRKIWLQQGRQDFDNFNIYDCSLNSDELVALYCYYYLQMHYSSSLLVFNNSTETLLDICNAKNSIYFIDIGCGPITSSIAFNHWLQDNFEGSKNTLYYGIDTSKSMCKKATELLKENDFVGEYSNFKVIKNLNDLTFNELQKPVNKNSVVIINCCYLFASYSLNINSFIEGIKRILELSKIRKTIIIYQNPSGYRQKWNEFKQKMSTFNSVNNYPQILSFSYKSVTQSDKYFNFKVDVDIIKNF